MFLFLAERAGFSHVLGPKDATYNRALYVCRIAGELQIVISNWALKQTLETLKQSALFFNMNCWTEMCTKTTISFVNHAIALHNNAICTDYNGLLETCVAASFNAQTRAYECKIYEDKFVAVRRENGKVFVVLQERAYCSFHKKPCVKNSICLNTSVWFELVKSIPLVNDFLSRL